MNWGNKLLLTFIVFISGMGYLVYRSMNTDFQLVEKDYYKSELAYQQVIDGINEANRLSAPVTVTQSNDFIQIKLPEEMKGKTVKGKIWLYCAYEQKNDKHLALAPDSNGVQTIDAAIIAPGSYTAKITWEEGDKKFYTETPLTIN